MKIFHVKMTDGAANSVVVSKRTIRIQVEYKNLHKVRNLTRPRRGYFELEKWKTHFSYLYLADSKIFEYSETKIESLSSSHAEILGFEAWNSCFLVSSSIYYSCSKEMINEKVKVSNPLRRIGQNSELIVVYTSY